MMKKEKKRSSPPLKNSSNITPANEEIANEKSNFKITETGSEHRASTQLDQHTLMQQTGDTLQVSPKHNTKASGVLPSELTHGDHSQRSGIIAQLQELEQLAMSLQPSLFPDMRIPKRKTVNIADKSNTALKLWKNVRPKEATMESCPEQPTVMLASQSNFGKQNSQESVIAEKKNHENCPAKNDLQELSRNQVVRLSGTIGEQS